MKNILKVMFTLVAVLIIGFGFAQIDQDDESSRDSASVDDVVLDIEVFCVNLLDVYTNSGDNNLEFRPEDLTSAGGTWAPNANAILNFKFDYTTNCTSTQSIGSQKITMQIDAIPSGLVAYIDTIAAGEHRTGDFTGGVIDGAKLGTAATEFTASAGTTHTLISDIQNVSAVDAATSLVMYGFAQGTNSTPMTITFTLED